MLANVVIMLSFLVTMLGILDFFLSDDLKKTISDRTLKLWNWLDDLRHLSFLDWLKNRQVQLIFSVTAISITLLAAAFLAYYVGISSDNYYYEKDYVYNHAGELIVFCFIVVVAMAPAMWMGTRLTSYILQLSTPFQHLYKGTITLTIALAISLLLLWASNLFLFQYEPSDTEGLFAALFFVFFFPTSIVLWIFWIIIFIPLLAVYSARGILTVLEITVRRVAEHAKGPVLAASILLGVVVALFKVFS